MHLTYSTVGRNPSSHGGRSTVNRHALSFNTPRARHTSHHPKEARLQAQRPRAWLFPCRFCMAYSMCANSFVEPCPERSFFFRKPAAWAVGWVAKYSTLVAPFPFGREGKRNGVPEKGDSTVDARPETRPAAAGWIWSDLVGWGWAAREDAEEEVQEQRWLWWEHGGWPGWRDKRVRRWSPAVIPADLRTGEATLVPVWTVAGRGYACAHWPQLHERSDRS